MKVAANISTRNAIPITIPGSYVSNGATCVYVQVVLLASVEQSVSNTGIYVDYIKEYPRKGDIRVHTVDN